MGAAETKSFQLAQKLRSEKVVINITLTANSLGQHFPKRLSSAPNSWNAFPFVKLRCVAWAGVGQVLEGIRRKGSALAWLGKAPGCMVSALRVCGNDLTARSAVRCKALSSFVGSTLHPEPSMGQKFQERCTGHHTYHLPGTEAGRFATAELRGRNRWEAPKCHLRIDSGQAKMTVSGLQGADLNVPVPCLCCLFETCQLVDCAGPRPTRQLGLKGLF